MFVADRALTEFYSAVFDIRATTERGGALPRHVEVDDIEATLARVWNLGGTIISTDDVGGIGAVPRSAIVRDPRGHLVSIVAARRASLTSCAPSFSSEAASPRSSRRAATSRRTLSRP